MYAVFPTASIFCFLLPLFSSLTVALGGGWGGGTGLSLTENSQDPL